MSNKQSKIITPANGSSLQECKQAVEKAGGEVVKELSLINSLVCEFPHEVDVSIALSSRNTRIKVSDNIKFRTCNNEKLSWFFPFPIRPFMPPRPLMPPMPPRPSKPPAPPKPKPPNSSGQIPDWGVKRIGALQATQEVVRRDSVRVGIIDTGVDFYHPDLRGNIKKGVNTINGKSYMDDNGHGTHVAGTIAALDNNIGVVGVAPTTELFIVKAFDKEGSASLSDIIEGLDWCIKNKVRVVNMSFSASESNEALYRAIKATDAAGIIMIAAAGNDGKGNSVNYPAKYAETVAVSAINKSDSIANFSSYGPEVNITAPGENIRSTYLRGSYKALSGTSMATPHVSGVIALVLREKPNLTVKDIRKLLNQSTEKLRNMSSIEQGAGLVRADNIIELLK